MDEQIQAASPLLQRYFDGGESLARMRHSRSGPVIIFASGPSAAGFPLDRYRHLPMMAVNGSIVRFAELGIRPLFYLCDDRGFVLDRLPLAIQGVSLAERAGLGLDALKTLLGLAPECLDGREVHLMQRVNRPLEGEPLSNRRYAWQVRNDPDIECGFSLFRQKPNRIGFSRNLGKGYFGSRTIPYAGLQLAHHLGFDKVFLVGLDLNPGPGRFYEQGPDAVPSRIDDDYADYILPSFELMARRVSGPGFQVYNLSTGSRLPDSLVPKIGLDQLDALLASA
ncbi:lipopolysaccharide core biosynthesis protein [Pseudomonas mangiferae]|uniref:Lipopolysaccharide core biosynthesis protein n=1 Tax=Pseudomonas mangiferae TaxID=2593654 RepID=A0A553GX35_9PSED|nr:lipopolysaccharide core biosynthesis protein [Pseudomonas mangiferae]TRX74050.1 lipopolysaccharide core biosynthesis protein [Pseudomonas mangiferae]